MGNKIDWLKERKSYLGGTDIAAILGLNRYRSAVDVYFEKTSDEVEDVSNRFTHWGTLLEEVIANEYARVKGVNIEEASGPIYHPEYPFLAANIDRWVTNKEYVLECKTANIYKEKEWGEEGTDQIPDAYLCQVAYYSAITGVPKVDIAVLIGGNDFRIYSYTKNEEFEDKIIKIACNFWNNNVLAKSPPEASNLHDISVLYNRSNGKGIKADTVVLDKVNSLKELKIKEKALTEEIQRLNLDIQGYMKDNELLVDSENNIIASWKNTQPRHIFNVEALKREFEDIYLRYVKASKPSRPFIIK